MNINKLDISSCAFFRFKRLNGNYLLTNDSGEHCFLEPALFDALSTGRAMQVKRDNPQKYNELSSKGFLRDSLDLDAYTHKYCLKNRFLSDAPSLHIIVATLRCDHKCIYCQTKAGDSKAKELDMDIETAKMVVERIFECPNPDITIEFQGGEPLINFEAVRFIIEYARSKNIEKKKRLKIVLVSNLSYMNEEILSFLIDNNVSICTSLDGPEYIHNRNRIVLDRSKNSYKNTIKWVKIIKNKYRKKGFNNYQPGALLTVSKLCLSYPKEIIDEYLENGFSGIHLRPATTFIFPRKTPIGIEYAWGDFIEFYKKAFEYILELNLKGRMFYERTALIFLTKVFCDGDPNFLDLRSPCGAGIGQLAYNYNGDVYTCDEGRMLSRINDESFRIGNVMTNDYAQIIAHPTVKAMCIASCLDNLPGCSECVYKPYCGVCPLINYSEKGNIFIQQPNNGRCRMQMAILDYLFEKIKDNKNMNIFERWLIFNGAQKKQKKEEGR